jgi:hypothetical protein
MKKLLLALTITLCAGAVSLVGCGDSGGGSGGGSNSGPSGGDDGGDDGGDTTSGQTCTSSHVCVNDVCNCGDDGKGMSCTDDTKCESECRVCM